MKQLLQKAFATATILTLVLLIICMHAAAQPVLQFKSIVQGLSSPLDIKNAGDGTNRLFIVEQTGKVKIYSNGAVLATPFIDLSNLITASGGEQGLLSIAFPPYFKKYRFFFVYYTNVNGDVTLARYRAKLGNPNIADPNSGVVLLSMPKPGGFTNHNGGCLQFGKDHYLYLTIGDGGSGGDPFGNAQNGQVLFGKMLRLDVAMLDSPYYKIPVSNPFVNDPNVRDEIWALGLRNSWRWSFDRLTGNTWIGDVGQDKIEEIDFRTKTQAAGSNYGWRCYEGNSTYNTSGCLASNNYTFPIFSYTHNFNTGGFAVIGGYVYRGDSFPALKGYYICADNVISNAWLIKPDGSGGWITTRQGNGIPEGIASFGESEKGELYAASINGSVFRIRDTGTLSVPAFNTRTDAAALPANASSIYPTAINNGFVTITLNTSFQFVRVMDMNGRERIRQDITNGKGSMRLDLSALNTGTYILQLVGNKTEAFKIMITSQ